MTRQPIPGGFLIAVDGIDGSGKTTLARGIESAILESNFKVVVTKEPTNGPWGQVVRDSAMTGRLSVETEYEYLVKDREEHVRDLIRPKLNDGNVVIMDRYYFSTAAYQGSAMDPQVIIRRNELFAPRPDLTLILDLEVTASLARIAARGDRPNHFERDKTLSICRGIFRKIGETYPDAMLIDGSLSPDEVLLIALKAFVRRVGEKFVGSGGLTADSVAAAMPMFASSR